MKKLISLVLVALMVLAVASASADAYVAPKVLDLEGYINVEVPTDIINYDDEIVMNYIQEFANVTQVPHPSYNTGKLATYLTVYADAHGLQSEIEEGTGNVVIWLPATEGYESAPMTAVQGHIDMVAATDEGVEHDWLNDPLELIWSANEVTANGTSLGADDDAGLAFMLTYMDYADTFVHGPMKFIFTVDEEVGCTGAHELDPKYVEDVVYLINVDGGYGGATISCAGSKYFHFSHAAEWVDAAEGSVAYDLAFTGLKGGHSAGVGGGKANALVAMANALLNLNQAGISFGIVSMEGGSATNAIPSDSKATIAIAAADVDAVTAVLDTFAGLFDGSYAATEPDYSFTYGASDAAVEKMLDADLSASLVSLMSVVPNNIHTLNQSKGTESSANLGVMTVNDEIVEFTSFMRSNSNFHAEQLTWQVQSLAAAYGFDFDIAGTIAAWPAKADDKLVQKASELFLEMTGEEFRTSIIHAGVECGEFAGKNPDIYIIATGVSGGTAGHTTAETMNFDMVKPSVDFLVALIEKLAVEG